MLDRAAASRARARACAFFTVAELSRSRKAEARQLWGKVQGALDLPLPDFFKLVSRATGAGIDVVQQTHASILHRMRKLGPRATVVERGTPQYPPRLGEVADAPAFLFVVGDLDLLYRPAIAVVGTRQPSEDGARRARKLGYLLSQRGIVVVSGLARGIDKAAHLGALEGGGQTVAVLGTPVDRVYPQEHAALQELIAETGALVSQFYPGERVQRYFFPMRNAVMSGLSLGTVVVEASETSGALIQARKCLQQGRKLFIPQSAIERPDLTWPKTFAARGAHVFRTIEDLLMVLEEDGLIPQQEPFTAQRTVASAPPLLTVDVRRAE
ncbi:MAG: DNA-protecting protein DprA [Actinomycetia bacterium]|nr:DNA-protecting protein DprA [Actinomycetes bacterium]